MRKLFQTSDFGNLHQFVDLCRPWLMKSSIAGFFDKFGRHFANFHDIVSGQIDDVRKRLDVESRTNDIARISIDLQSWTRNNPSGISPNIL